jgi:hypothetical protein
LLHFFRKNLQIDYSGSKKLFSFTRNIQKGDEIELSALGRQCLNNRKIPNLECLRAELKPWCQNRNRNQRGVDWRFSTDNARIKLKHL